MEVQDTFFRTDSAVVHQNLVYPSVFALALLFAKGSPSARLVIAGHTDTRAPDAYNQPLSEERAANALACLMGDRGSFVRLSLARHKIADAKQILKFVTVKLGFDSDPGPFDENEATLRGPARKFQEQYNSKLAALGIPNATALTPDGVVGPAWAFCRAGRRAWRCAAPLIERMAVQIVELSHGYLSKKVGSQSSAARISLERTTRASAFACARVPGEPPARRASISRVWAALGRTCKPETRLSMPQYEGPSELGLWLLTQERS